MLVAQQQSGSSLLHNTVLPASMSGQRGTYNSSSMNQSSRWPRDTRSTNQQYLTPEDMYNLSGGGNQFQGSNRSYPASRHSSESHSPSYIGGGSVHHQYPTHPQVAPSYQQRQSYNDPSRHATDTAGSQSYSTTNSSASYNSPQYGAYSSAHAHAGGHSLSGTRDRHAETPDQEKGKAKEPSRRSPSDKSASGGRHAGGTSSSGRKAGPALPPGEKLVSGVFIRY